MKITKIKVKNFRLLRDFSMDLEEELSLVIGKNNTGKTSILAILDKFLTESERHRFAFDDFSIGFKGQLKKLIEDGANISREDYQKDFNRGIRLKLFVEYGKDDNLANLNRVLMDLDPASNVVVLSFEYSLSYTDYEKLKKDYREFAQKEQAKIQPNGVYQARGLYDFLQAKHASYFAVVKKTIEYDATAKAENEINFIDLIKEKISIKQIINFKYISAKREVGNTNVDKTLSGQTSKIYQRTEISDGQSAVFETFKDELAKADTSLSNIYKNLFDGVIQKVRDFGGIRINESEIAIISTLRHQELLEGNTTVVYRYDMDNQLPEHYNGLGYMNLISMIFEIEILLHEFKRERECMPADINLLFIEEPEAHTHPQMQYVFIKNIKKLIRDGIKRPDGENRTIQYVISTHSSCIVADSEFSDLKYLKRDDSGNVAAKNLKDLEKEYAAVPDQYQFLKQYLTISRAEVFFADKAVLIEGDTERILIPTMMKKIDLDEAKRHKDAKTKDDCLPLLSQNVSIIEVGAYSHIFEIFVDFIGIRSLIITDLDTVDEHGGACNVAAGHHYSNSALKFFFGEGVDLTALKGFNLANKTLRKNGGAWLKDINGKLCIVYQTSENGYHARSFEDSFIHLNRPFIVEKKEDFRGLKNKALFENAETDAYELAEKCILKKTHFALDILFHSDVQLGNWNIPSYIREGLLWLKKD